MEYDLKSKIRDVPDFPKPGIVFKDITTLIADPKAFSHTVDKFINFTYQQDANLIVGIESRGFIFGAALAYELELPFAIARKPGKLPSTTVSESYELEYGTDRLEMHIDSISKYTRALIIDDLLATGGTASAVTRLVENLDGKVAGLAFVIELDFLNGRKKLKDYEICSLTRYENE